MRQCGVFYNYYLLFLTKFLPVLVFVWTSNGLKYICDEFFSLLVVYIIHIHIHPQIHIIGKSIHLSLRFEFKIWKMGSTYYKKLVFEKNQFSYFVVITKKVIWRFHRILRLFSLWGLIKTFRQSKNGLPPGSSKQQVEKNSTDPSVNDPTHSLTNIE